MIITAVILLSIALAGFFWVGYMAGFEEARRRSRAGDAMRAERRALAALEPLPRDYHPTETLQKAYDRYRRQTTVEE